MENKPSTTNELLEKFKALGIGEKIILIAAVVFLIDSFLPWYSVDLGPFGSVTRSGWQSPGAIWSILALLVAIAMAAVIAVQNLAKEGTLPENISGVSWPKIQAGGGIAVALLVIIKLLNESSDLGFGFYLGIICAAALAAGGILMYRQEMAGGTS